MKSIRWGHVFPCLFIVFSIQVSFSNLVFAETLSKEFTEGEQIVDHAIAACKKIRESGNPDVRLPRIFDLYLLKTMDRVEISHLPEEQKKILEKEAAELLKGDRLTLFQWNVFHYRLSVLFSGYEKTTKYEYPSKGSAAAAAERLEAAKEQSKMHLYLKRTFGALDELQFSEEYDSCPIALFESLGIAPLNKAFSKGVYPLGVSSSWLYYDGGFSDPHSFFTHDQGHMNNALRHQGTFFRNSTEFFKTPYFNANETKAGISRFMTSYSAFDPKHDLKVTAFKRKMHQEFLERVKRLPIKEQEMIQTIYFEAIHEHYDTEFSMCLTPSSNSDDWLSSAPNSRGARFLRVSDLNLTLPKSLQGSLAFLEFLESDREALRKNFGPADTVQKQEKIFQYLAEAKKVYCREVNLFLNMGSDHTSSAVISPNEAVSGTITKRIQDASVSGEAPVSNQTVQSVKAQ
jgi:hypothetical protein